MNWPNFSDWKVPSPLPSLRGSSVRGGDGGGDGDGDDDGDCSVNSMELSVSAGMSVGRYDRYAAYDTEDGGEGEGEDGWDPNDYDRRHSRRRRRSGCCHRHSVFRSGSRPGAVVNLCSATLGAGVLSLPYALSQCGIVPGLVLLIAAAACTISSIDMIISTVHTLGLDSYEQATQQLLGWKAAWVVEASIFVFCFGTAIAYIVAAGDILEEGVIDVFRSELPSYVTREFAMIAFWVAVMLPLSLMKKIDSLRFASMFGIGSIAVLVSCCVIHAIRDLIEVGDGGGDDAGGNSTGMVATIDLHSGMGAWTNSLYLGNHSDSDTVPPNHAGEDVRWFLPESFWAVVRACPIVIFAFSCQPNVVQIFCELQADNGNPVERSGSTRSITAADNRHSSELTRTERRGNLSVGPISYGPGRDSSGAGDGDDASGKVRAMQSVTRSAVLICVTLYSLIGTFAYIDFGSRAQDNILKNYCVQKTHDPMMIAAFLCITVAVVMAFPLNVFPARVTLEGVWARLYMEVSTQGEIPIDGDNIDGDIDLDNVDDDDALDRPLLEEIVKEGETTAAADEVADGLNRDYDELQQISSVTLHVFLTLLVSGGALLVALIVPNISFIFGLMGGTASSIICFIFPGLFVLKVNQREDGIRQQLHLPPTVWRKVQASALIIVGVTIGVLSTGTTLYSTFLEKDNSDKVADICSKIHR